MLLTSPEKKLARNLIREYLEDCERYRASKHYSQARPMRHLGKSPREEWTADCSGYVTSAFRWADLKAPFKVKDPNGVQYNYNGWGYTGTLLSNNIKRRVGLDRKFFIGDIALYGTSLQNTTHCTICRRNGDAQYSSWSSHGNEAGPYPTFLTYRRDLLCVLRSVELA